MKKFLVPAMIVLAAAATVNVHAATPSDNLSRHALGEAKDTRSAWAKSQDMYVEPTLRMTETTVPVTPGQEQSVPAQAVPAGAVPATGTSTTTVFGPDGQPVSQPAQQMPQSAQPMPQSAQPMPQSAQPMSQSGQPVAPGQPVPMDQGTSGAPVQDLSRPQP